VSCHDANIWVRREAIKIGLLSLCCELAGGIELAGLTLISVTPWRGHPVLSVGGIICSDLLPRPLSLHLEWMKSETTSLVFGLRSLWSSHLAWHTHSCTTERPLCLSFHCTTTSLQVHKQNAKAVLFLYHLFDFCLWICCYLSGIWAMHVCRYHYTSIRGWVDLKCKYSWEYTPPIASLSVC